jgi:hypothetical protein
MNMGQQAALRSWGGGQGKDTTTLKFSFPGRNTYLCPKLFIYFFIQDFKVTPWSISDVSANTHTRLKEKCKPELL